MAGTLVLGACGSSSRGASAPAVATGAGTPSTASLAGQTITLDNGQHEQTTTALVDAFQKATSRRGQVPADVRHTENSAPLARLDEAELLAPLDTTTLAQVPADDSTDGSWVGVSARLSSPVYDATTLKESDLPTSVLQLADPRCKGKLDLAPGETDFQPIVTSGAAAKGAAAAKTFLGALKPNAVDHDDPDNDTLVANVEKGATQPGIVNHDERTLLPGRRVWAVLLVLPASVPDFVGLGVLRQTHRRRDPFP